MALQNREIGAAEVEVVDLSGALGRSEWDLATPRSRRFAHGFLLTGGRGEVHLEDGYSRVEAPCVLWLPNGLSARIQLDAGIRGSMMTVSDTALGRVIPASSIAAPLREAIDRPLLGVPLDLAAARTVLGDIDAIRHEAADDLPGRREAVLSRLCLVLIAFWRIGGTSTAKPQSSPRVLVQNFLQLVELNARQQWRIDDYARAMGISTDRLTSAIRRATGLTPLELVHRRLLEDAEALLERSVLQVREIADALGFRDAGYFNRFFSRRMGMSPGRYRQQLLNRRPGDNSYAAWP